MAEYRLKIDTTNDRVLEFLDRLAHDEDFQTALQSNPQETLYDYGVEVPDELVPETVVLPDPEDIEALLAGTPPTTLLTPPSPALFYPVFTCFYAFPFLTAESGS